MAQEQKLEFEVKIVSNETIKPSLPPTSHPKTFTLSLLDQIFPAISIPVLLFYTPITRKPQKVDISGLKTSLSLTLDKFYPLAGRFLDESTISCNNQGIPFIETKIDCHLSAILTSPHKIKFLPKFLPPLEFEALGPRPISELVPLAFQINVFLCGGVVLGCYMLHKIIDTASLGTFLKHWARLASNENEKSVVQPNFEAIIKAFPPLPRVDHVFVPDLCNQLSTEQSHPINIIAKSFLFTSVALNNLKPKAASKLVPKPTSFEALAGFVWQQAALAAAASGTQLKHSKLSFSVNMRKRMSPPVPNESMGNLVTNVHPEADFRSNDNLQELVKEIHSELYKLNQKIAKVYQGEKGAEVLCAERKAESQGVMEYQPGLYRLSSWCKIGLNEADFGFGNLVSIIPTDGRELPLTLRNFLFFTDYNHPSSGDGIEAWFFLEEKEMQILESNPQFLSFASPN